MKNKKHVINSDFSSPYSCLHITFARKRQTTPFRATSPGQYSEMVKKDWAYTFQHDTSPNYTSAIVHTLLNKLSQNKYQEKTWYMNQIQKCEPSPMSGAAVSQIPVGSLPLWVSLSSEGRTYAQIHNSGLKMLL